MGKKRICLDPGHYGEKYNAGVVSGYYESATVWKLTQYEKEYLEQMGIEVLVTRSNINENPDLTARGKMAAGCDLFVSNHTNACGTEAVNRAVAIHFTDRNETLVDDQSREFAAQIAKVIQNTMGVDGYQIYSRLSDNDRDGNGKKDDNYYGVLNGSFLAGVPGVIAEHSFHTNIPVSKAVGILFGMPNLSYQFPTMQIGGYLLILILLQLILSVWEIRDLKKRSLTEQMRAME